MNGLTGDQVGAAAGGLSLIGAQGAAIEAHASLPSTNDRVAELAAEGAAEGSLVVAGAQETGRGRMGRAWCSPPGGLYVSLLLRPTEDELRRLPATLLAGLAVAEAIDATSSARAELKWPNDVLIGGKKVAGILGELTRDERGHRLVLGIGVNVSTDPGALPEEVRAAATSVAAEAGEAPALDAVLRELLARFEGYFLSVRRGGGAHLLASASERMSLLGKSVRARLERKTVVGTASGLSATGALVIELEGGEREVIVAGEVEEVRLA